MQTQLSSERSLWLFSRRADFWLACGGASIGLLAAILLILLRGDRELDAIDFVLSEFHLGATYDAILRRRLWHHRQFDVLLIPLVILVLTYALSLGGQTILLTSIAMYAAVWHRGRQSLGVARFYQRGMGGPVSRTHDVFVPRRHLSAHVGGCARIHSSGAWGIRRRTLCRPERRRRNNLDRRLGRGALGDRLFCLDAPAEPRRQSDVHAAQD